MTDERKEKVNQFVNRLYNLQRTLESSTGETGLSGRRPIAQSEARAALAQLRRAVGHPPGAAVESLPHIAPYLPSYPTAWETEAFFLVGGLFGFHPTVCEAKENLGDALRHIGEHESAQKRFAALLDCRAERLAPYLRQAIGLARGGGTPVNYRRLLFDLLDWDHPRRIVQIKWAGAYWREEFNDSPADPLATSTAGKDLNS